MCYKWYSKTKIYTACVRLEFFYCRTSKKPLISLKSFLPIDCLSLLFSVCVGLGWEGVVGFTGHSFISSEQMVNMCLFFIHKHQTPLASLLFFSQRKDTERPPSLNGMVGYMGFRTWSLPGLLLAPPFCLAVWLRVSLRLRVNAVIISEPKSMLSGTALGMCLR